MKFFLVYRSKILLKFILIILFCSANTYAFDDVLQTIFSSNDELMNLQKDLDKNTTNNSLTQLESALLEDFRNQDKDKLKSSIIKIKYNIALKILIYHLNILENRELTSLYYNYNNEILKFYNNYPKQKLLKENKSTIASVTNQLKQINKRFVIQNKKYKQSIIDYQQSTGQNFKQTPLKQQINNLKIPKSHVDAYNKFVSKNKIEKDTIKNILQIKNEEDILTNLKNYYNNSVPITQLYKDKIQQLNKKLNKKQNILEEFSQKEIQLSLQEEIIKLQYQLLFIRVKILFITSDIFNISKTKKFDVEMKNIRLQNVSFLYNQDHVTDYSMKLVIKNINKLKKINNYILVLNGYSESLELKKNPSIIKQRLDNLKKSIINLGIDKNKIKINVILNAKPIASNKTNHGRLLNRRIEFKVYKDNN